jgi:hypothetical protein
VTANGLACEDLYYEMLTSDSMRRFVGQVVNLRPIGGALRARPAGIVRNVARTPAQLAAMFRGSATVTDAETY